VHSPARISGHYPRHYSFSLSFFFLSFCFGSSSGAWPTHGGQRLAQDQEHYHQMEVDGWLRFMGVAIQWRSMSSTRPHGGWCGFKVPPLPRQVRQKLSLMLIGVQVKGLACGDLGASTHIGISRNLMLKSPNRLALNIKIYIGRFCLKLDL
jgi:hypothetical protein